MSSRLMFPFTANELFAALSGETRPRVRKRLIALQTILRVATTEEAARAVKAGHGSVASWVTRAQAGGLAAVLTDLPRRPPPMTPEFIAAVQAGIATALKRPLRRRLKTRLQGISAALAGKPLQKAAALGGVTPPTLKRWLVHIRAFGITALLAYWMPSQPGHLKVSADPAALRAHAASEGDPEKRKRLIALACVAEGLCLNDAAVESGISDGTIITSIRQFQQGGIAAIYPKKRPPSGRRPLLGQKELEKVAALARTTPQPTAEQLRVYIEAEFGVRYSLLGVKNMLKKQLGIVYGARVSIHN
jgi:transposase